MHEGDFKDPFEDIVENFQLIDGQGQDSSIAPEYEPSVTSREGILRLADNMLPELLDIPHPGLATYNKTRDRILEEIAEKAGLTVGQTLSLHNIASYFIKRGPKQPERNFVERDTKATGVFKGLELATWYDIDEGEDPLRAELNVRQHGIHMLLYDPTIAYGGRAVRYIDTEMITVPLNHGKPEIGHDLSY